MDMKCFELLGTPDALSAFPRIAGLEIVSQLSSRLPVAGCCWERDHPLSSCGSSASAERLGVGVAPKA